MRDVIDIVQKAALDLWEGDGRRKLEEQGESRQGLRKQRDVGGRNVGFDLWNKRRG